MVIASQWQLICLKKPSEFRNCETTWGTPEFLARLPQGRTWPSTGEIDDETNRVVDGARIRCVRQMDKLRKEFVKAGERQELTRNLMTKTVMFRVF